MAFVRLERSRILELETEICAVAAAVRLHRARLLQLIGEFAAGEGWRATGAISCAHWLADLLDIELCTAREQVRVARALRELPLIRAAFDASEISYAKAREITRMATVATEADLLEVARHAPAGALTREIANWHTRRAPEAMQNRQWNERACTYRQEYDGSVTITLRLPPEEAAKVTAVFDGATRKHNAPAGASVPQRRADAAVRVITSARTAASHHRTEVVLHHRAGQTDIGGLTLTPATAERLLCDCDVRLIVHRADGSPTDVGLAHRLITPKLRRLLEERDRHCTFPGCRTTAFLEAHHIVPWSQGGETNLANLTLRCSYHHRYGHEHQHAPAQEHRHAPAQEYRHAPAGASSA